MNLRRLSAQSNVAFVFNQHQCACFGDQEIRPRDSHLGGKKLCAQAPAGHRGDFSNFAWPAFAQLFRKEIGDLATCLVNGRSDDVRGFFMSQLDDVLAQIGFNRPDARGFERVIQFNLFSRHRLALDH